MAIGKTPFQCGQIPLWINCPWDFQNQNANHFRTIDAISEIDVRPSGESNAPCSRWRGALLHRKWAGKNIHHWCGNAARHQLRGIARRSGTRQRHMRAEAVTDACRANPLAKEEMSRNERLAKYSMQRNVTKPSQSITSRAMAMSTNFVPVECCGRRTCHEMFALRALPTYGGSF